MPREVRWERMFRDELAAELARCPVAWFAYGLCEPHGDHNALGLDALKAHGITRAAAQAHGGVVAPPDYWHIHEIAGYGAWAATHVGETQPFLTAVPPWIHFRNVLYHIRAADAAGFHAAVLITGHYGPNWVDLQTLIAAWQPHFTVRLRGLPDFEANLDSRGDHAGMVETSQLWHLEPDCVDLSRLPDPVPPSPNFAAGGDAHQASRRLGERMVAHQVEWLGRAARELLAAYREPAGGRRAVTFDETEAIWAETARTLLPQLKSLAQRFNTADQLPPGSRWAANMDARLPAG